MSLETELKDLVKLLNKQGDKARKKEGLLTRFCKWYLYVKSVKDRERRIAKNIAEHEARLLKKRANCSHLKGGRTRLSALYARPSNLFKPHPVFPREYNRMWSDYNLSDHTFIDGSRQIKCLTCGKDWWQGKENWNDALKMMAQSSNTRTSSEVVPVIKSSVVPVKISFWKRVVNRIRGIK